MFRNPNQPTDSFSKPDTDSVDYKRRFNTGFQLLSHSEFADAFLIFSNISEKTEDVAALFNLALCEKNAGDDQKAILTLEKALNLAKKIQSPEIDAAFSSAVLSKNYAALSQKEKESAAYLSPMPQEYPRLFSKSAKEKITRVLIDVCLKCELWDKIIILSASLQGKGYINVEKALETAKQKK
ncbi:hypothetical protein [Methanolapillus millepedarum]|uniref:hypothetical protein n=1 Tax=Methanolapillus millepedarum TaxID=3028296 RepID=UPI0030B873E3